MQKRIKQINRRQKFSALVPRFLIVVLGITSNTSQTQTMALPSLTDLGPKWSQVSTGMPLDSAIALMGTPFARKDSRWLGVSVNELVWRDLLQSYRAQFIAGYLATTSKEGVTYRLGASAGKHDVVVPDVALINLSY